MKRIAMKSWLTMGLVAGCCVVSGPKPAALAQVSNAVQSPLEVSKPPAEPADYASELPRIAPLSPQEELRSFQVQPGYRVELVAAEPLVMDPVAFAFTASGALFVAEMRDYSEQETEHLGSIALLVDSDRDGQMDSRTTFADNLSWPTALWPWQDGVVVAEPPHLIFLRDTDDDGVSDRREIWYDGFGRSNVQGLVNSLRWTVDGRIEGATSSSGAELKKPQAANASEEAVTLRGRDFSMDPLTQRIRPASGGGQHGMCFNSWGDKFVTSNSDHLQQILDMDLWLSQHSQSVPVPSLRRSIAIDGPQAEVYRSSPVEPWRIVRTRLRMSGATPGIVEGGGRAAGYFTGATGTWVMDGDAGFGTNALDTALVCDVGSNLVHRKRLTSTGLFWSGERIDDRTELLRSSDIWFRPVQLGDGPDGALYIADMYREVIEHPKSLPPVIKRHLDLTSGNDRGRIWRVAPTTETTITAQRQTGLPGKLTNKELAKLLHHPVAWQRRMASQLLIERDARDALAELERSSLAGPRPEGRLLALHVLDRYQKLSDAVLRRALADTHPRVLQHAVALAGQNDRAAALTSQLNEVPIDDVHVRLALAMTAAALPPVAKADLLQRLMSVENDDALVRATIVIAAGNDSPALFAPEKGVAVSKSWLALVLPAWTRVLGEPSSAANAEFQEAVSQLIERELSRTDAIRDTWIDSIIQLPNRASADSLLALLSDQARAELDAYLTAQVAERRALVVVSAEGSVATSAVKTVTQAEVIEPSSGSQAIASLQWMRLLPKAEQEALVAELIQPTVVEPLQLATVEAVMWNDPESALKAILPELKRMTPSLKRQVLTLVVGYSQSLSAIADAIESHEIARAEIAPDVRQLLFSVPNKQQADRFRLLLDTASTDRSQVIERYRPDLAQIAQFKAPQIAAGQMTFQRVCAQCHRLQDKGNDVGPPLKQLADKSPEQLLDIVLDPNREVDPKFLGYSALLVDGRVLAGIIREESAGQIVLAETGGKHHTIARSDIEQLKTTGLSLMPVGLEEQITPEQMAQLIAYLKQAGTQ